MAISAIVELLFASVVGMIYHDRIFFDSTRYSNELRSGCQIYSDVVEYTESECKCIKLSIHSLISEHKLISSGIANV